MGIKIQRCTRIKPDGAKCDDFWKNNKAHGKGVFLYVYGDKYEGQCERDISNGKESTQHKVEKHLMGF